MRTKQEWAKLLRSPQTAWNMHAFRSEERAELADYIDPPAPPSKWPDNGELIILGHGGLSITDDQTPYNYRTMDGKPANLSSELIPSSEDNSFLRLATDNDITRFCINANFKGAILGRRFVVPIIREWAMLKFGQGGTESGGSIDIETVKAEARAEVEKEMGDLTIRHMQKLTQQFIDTVSDEAKKRRERVASFTNKMISDLDEMGLRP